MKTFILLLLALIQVSAWAQDKRPVATDELEAAWDDPQAYLNHPDIRENADKIKATLNIGSDEDLIKIAKSVNPVILKKFMALKIELSPEQVEKLENLAMNNKGKLVMALMTGNIPQDLIAQAEKIVPELKTLDEKSKADVFKAAGKTVNKLVFDRMVKSELVVGYLSGDVSSGMVAQVNSKLGNIRKITLGGIEIEDVHMKVEVGYPRNGLTIVSGKVKDKDSKFSYQGELLGLSHDIRKHALEVSVVKARINYNILPWLQTYSGVGFGVRSYTDATALTLDTKVGVEAKGRLGPVSGRVFVDGTYQVAEKNTVVTCGADLGIEVLKTDFLDMQTGILSRITYESDPREHGNRLENFNGAGISGHF